MIRKLLSTSTFRLALVYLALFGLSVAGLLAFLYRTTSVFMREQIGDTVEAEIGGLAEQYRRDGLIGLTRVIIERSEEQRWSLYLLADPNRRRIAGNLSAWPTEVPDENGWVEFSYQRTESGVARTHYGRARELTLVGDLRLLVGRDTEERRELDKLLKNAIAWTLALTIAVGLAGGVLMSRNVLRRIEAIDRAGRAIMAGDLSRRIAVRGSGDELDRLAENLNAMLDRIEKLMTGMRQVSDNIAHDLRSPLTRLRSRLEVTLLGPADTAAYRAALERTVAEADLLLQTFNALLEIARTEAGLDPESLEPVDVGELAHDAAELYEPLAEEKQQTLAVDAPHGLMARAHRHLLFQALANLIDNAVKYTPEGGRIAVQARREGTTVLLSVTDSGPGIPQAELGRVINRFVRLEVHRNSPGSGLGLSLVKAVADAHGATLEFANADPGLRVTLRLAAALQRPARDQHAEGGRRAEAKAPASKALASKAPVPPSPADAG